MAEEASTRGRAGADLWVDPNQLLLLSDDDDAQQEPRSCDTCGGRADWVLTDNTGIAQGFSCIPCREVHRRRRNRWYRRAGRRLRHAVRRS